MKKLPLIFLFFSFSFCFSQNPDIKRTYHWYFGNGAALDFSSGTPVPITNSAMTAEEGSASISDTCGDLLFYTDGDTVWNRNNQAMPNGTGLMGCWSSTQSSLIVPQPGNDSIYYIFLTDCGENLGANGLRYSTVNINLNGGSGDVVQKNVLLYAPSMEKLAATYHSNGTDIWILSCHRFPIGLPTYQYYAYLLKTAGVDTTPVISPSIAYKNKYEDGYLRFSHQGNKVANAWHAGNCIYCDTLEILDFDNNTGFLSNSYTLMSDTAHLHYGVVFSPDDSKLYHSIFSELFYPDVHYKIFQYDLSSNNPAIIAASKTLIQASDSTNTLGTNYGALQNNSDGKIYVTKMGNIWMDTLDVITNPNAAGLACNYLVNGTYCGHLGFGLPNFVDSYFKGNWQPPCSTGIEEDVAAENNILIYPSPFSDYTTLRISNFDELRITNAELKIYDVLGHIVLQSAIKNPQSEIHRGNLNCGIYFLKIQIGNYNYIHKLIIF